MNRFVLALASVGLTLVGSAGHCVAETAVAVTHSPAGTGAEVNAEDEDELEGEVGRHPNRPRWPQPALGPSQSGGPEILFTFDDGPHERYTPLILEALGNHGIRAIFFVAGWRLQGRGERAERQRAAAARALDEGHVLGNHTMEHARMCSVSRKRAEWELDTNSALLTALSGMPVAFYRNPYGSRCRQIEGLLEDRGLAHLHWDIDPREYLAHDSEATRGYLIDKLSRLEGRAVILLHDTHFATAKALPHVLDWIAQENAARRSRGQREIRILSYADVARERLPVPIRRLLAITGDAAAELVPPSARRLLGPLFRPAPVPSRVQARSHNP